MRDGAPEHREKTGGMTASPIVCGLVTPPMPVEKSRK